MGNDILYRWEDSPALKHHCGFCERPLSHPGARSSCFGPHAEPCHRFHQAMFMRNRAHMCAMCNGADEAHHKRHQDVAERLRSIYESCGEDWPIIPADEPERGRASRRKSECDDDDGERLSTSRGAHAKKKDKKEQKRLTRAASRRRVITLEEIKYIESVLHPASTHGDAEGPHNPEEVDEIERHLRYNAQVYNMGAKRRVMKEFARVPDADVDFEGEMERILEILRVAELLKCNTKNRGLQGKELKHFDELVAEFKKRVVEDLLLLKKEEVEVRMRRASYLRYTNRASFDVVEERYAAKDWKTGLKFSGSPAVHSMSSGSTTANEEEVEEEDGETAVDCEHEPDLSFPTPHGPDLRHLRQGHKRIGSGGKLEECVSVLRSPTRLSIEPPEISKRRPPPQLRIVSKPQPDIDPPPPYSSMSIRKGNIRNRSPRRPSPGQVLGKCIIADNNGWQSVGRASQKISLPTKRQEFAALPATSVWVSEAGVQSEDRSTDTGDDSFTTSSSYDLVQEVVTTPDAKKVTFRPSSNSSSSVRIGGATRKPTAPEVSANLLKSQQHAGFGHPVFEQKKLLKKRQREAERKARRVAERECAAVSNIAVEVSTNTTRLGVTSAKQLGSPWSYGLAAKSEEQICGGPVLVKAPEKMDMYSKGTTEALLTTKVASHLPLTLAPNDRSTAVPTRKPMTFVMGKASLLDIPTRKTTKRSKTEFESAQPCTLSPTSAFCCRSIPAAQSATEIIKKGCHSDWKKFNRHLRVDSLSHPDSVPIDSCAHNNICPFEISGIIDCPYHKSNCGHCDPRHELCFVIHPTEDPSFYVGPFNGPRAEKLIAQYESNPRTKGKLMLVDDDMLPWLLRDGLSIERGPNVNSRDMPPDLSLEVSCYFHGEGKGRLMRQTEVYRDLAFHNNAEKDPLSYSELSQIYETFKQGCGSNPNICFCETQHSNDTNLVECAFRHCLHQGFHRNCVQRLGVNKVSSWYCPDCERVMGRMARMVLVEVSCMRDSLPALTPTALDLLTGEYALGDMGPLPWPDLDDYDSDVEVWNVADGLLQAQAEPKGLTVDHVVSVR